MTPAQVARATQLTSNWPYACQPLVTPVSLQRVKRAATVILYIDVMVRFLMFTVDLTVTRHWVPVTCMIGLGQLDVLYCLVFRVFMVSPN